MPAGVTSPVTTVNCSLPRNAAGIAAIGVDGFVLKDELMEDGALAAVVTRL